MTQLQAKTAIIPTRNEDYPEWYQQVIKAADMAENSPVRGCMVIKPWGFGIWERIRDSLDQMIKETGHDNVYFPLFIPLSFLEKEAAHVEGFAKECAVVTHHRLEEREGQLVPTGALEEPLIIRPTSETIIGDSFSKWIESYRDLPLLINQWANVVRWEMRPRIFLRTSEFLWQEGHTAHAAAEEAKEETLKMLEVYRILAEDILAIPVILGEKSPAERFPGAESTYTLEMMMQDRKALQGGTSHYLGQNFSKAQGVQFSNQAGELEYAYTTSWGVTTRLIGGMIMCHGDDDGLRLPPRIAPKQIVIIPVIPKKEEENEVLAFAEKVKKELSSATCFGEPVRIEIDKRDRRGGEKNWEWVKKGVPIRIEAGPRDIASGTVMIARRDRPHKDKSKVALESLQEVIPDILGEIQANYFEQARAFRDMHINKDIEDIESLKKFFTPKNIEKPEIHGGFVLAKWCGDPESEKLLDPLKLTIRCIPLSQSKTKGRCILTGKEAVTDIIIAKAY